MIFSLSPRSRLMPLNEASSASLFELVAQVVVLLDQVAAHVVAADASVVPAEVAVDDAGAGDAGDRQIDGRQIGRCAACRCRWRPCTLSVSAALALMSATIWSTVLTAPRRSVVGERDRGVPKPAWRPPTVSAVARRRRRCRAEPLTSWPMCVLDRAGGVGREYASIVARTRAVLLPVTVKLVVPVQTRLPRRTMWPSRRGAPQHGGDRSTTS